jgi:DNA-binding transcriptional LysR family regulator
VVVFVNSAHPFFGRDTISIAELEGQTVIQREVGSTTRKAMEGALAAHGTCIDVMLDLGSREGVWMAVEQGLGIGFVADFEFVAHPNLRMVRIHDAKIITRYYLAFLRERRASRMIEAFCAVAPVEGEAP